MHEFIIKTSAETNECRSRSRLPCEYQNIDFWLENYANAFSKNFQVFGQTNKIPIEIKSIKDMAMA